jgi:hypothetical protein
LNRAWNLCEGETGSVFPDPDEEQTSGKICIRTLEGVHSVSWDDWIIKGVAGELYPCKPVIFEASYEPADDEQAELPYVEVLGSSNVTGFLYNPVARTLKVTYRGGAKYCYMDVPLDVYTELVEAESRGKYISANIKNVYGYERLKD